LYKHALLAQRSSKRGDAADTIVIFLFIFFGQLMCEIRAALARCFELKMTRAEFLRHALSEALRSACDLKRLKETKIYCDGLCCRRRACIRWNCEMAARTLKPRTKPTIR
jgi:hypothetical protein